MKRIFVTLFSTLLLLQCQYAVSAPRDRTSTVALLPSNQLEAVQPVKHISTLETDGLYHLALPSQEEPLTTSIGTGVLNGNLERLKQTLNQHTSPRHAPSYYLDPKLFPTQSNVSVEYYTFSQLMNICFNKYLIDVYVMPRVMNMVPQSITNLVPGKTITF